MMRLSLLTGYLLGMAVVLTASAPGDCEEYRARDSLGQGGLYVRIGAECDAKALELARSGRFLVQIVDTDAARVEKLRREIEAAGLYGLVSVIRIDSDQSLPYAENLVNRLSFDARPGLNVPSAELFRVLCPGGTVSINGTSIELDALQRAGFGNVESREGRTLARKPWPTAMDGWTHPRHAADGNAVSNDLLAGPPRRIRWVAGPSKEIANMVTAGGRNYYGGLWTRDSFNGLRLWQRPLTPSPARGGFGFQITANSMLPIAGQDCVYAMIDGKVVALDGATGATLREYPEAGQPSELLAVGTTLLAIDRQTIRAVDSGEGQLLWKHEAPLPKYTIAGDGQVFFLCGAPRQGGNLTAVSLDLATGSVRWKHDDYPWLPLVRRCVYHGGLLAMEISTLADEKAGNMIHMVSADDGRLLWSRTFVPSMNHMKQARAMFVGDALWVLEDRKCMALDPRTGEQRSSCPAGLCHCFPPVATQRFMFSGEMELTDLASGEMDANRITKAACGRDVGWVPANGLINVTPKHCVCWPMLRGYAALAPAKPGSEATKPVEQFQFALERGVEPAAGEPDDQDSWPCYRHDPWRTGSTPAKVPVEPKPLWEVSLGTLPDGPIGEDWRENPFSRGPLTAPVIAGGTVYVARTDAHQIVALDAASGENRWRYTADGRIDTPPTIHRGLCLFGTRSGSVICLRASDGKLVWRLRAAPNAEQIVAYGQLESPWPVAGSVAVIDDVAYFAAGRQPLADGGILVFAVEPKTGKRLWTRRLDSVPTKNFYGSSALEFPNFDLLHQEGSAVAMSRWLFDLADGKMVCKDRDVFARLTPGEGTVVVPRGLWTYAPRHQPRHAGERSEMQPLAVYRDSTIVGCLGDQRTLFRRDFTKEDAKKFDLTWITGWAASENFRKKTGDVYPPDRLAKSAAWSVGLFPDAKPQQTVAAMIWAGETLVAVGTEGDLITAAAADGRTLGRVKVAAPIWDGLAAAGGKLFLSTANGRVIALGER